jgi:hypothetical protein
MCKDNPRCHATRMVMSSGKHNMQLSMRWTAGNDCTGEIDFKNTHRGVCDGAQSCIEMSLFEKRSAKPLNPVGRACADVDSAKFL